MKKFSILAIVVLVFVGCAAIQTQTQQERYLQSLTFFNDTLEQYLTLFAAADLATQAEWEKTYHPIFKSAGSGLEAGGLSLNDYTKETAWNDAKVKLLTILVNLGLLELEAT